MVLLWDSLMYCNIVLLKYFVPSTTLSGKTGWRGFDTLYCLFFFFFFFFFFNGENSRS